MAGEANLFVFVGLGLVGLILFTGLLWWKRPKPETGTVGPTREFWVMFTLVNVLGLALALIFVLHPAPFVTNEGWYPFSEMLGIGLMLSLALFAFFSVIFAMFTTRRRESYRDRVEGLWSKRQVERATFRHLKNAYQTALITFIIFGITFLFLFFTNAFRLGEEFIQFKPDGLRYGVMDGDKVYDPELGKHVVVVDDVASFVIHSGIAFYIMIAWVVSIFFSIAILGRKTNMGINAQLAIFAFIIFMVASAAIFSQPYFEWLSDADMGLWGVMAVTGGLFLGGITLFVLSNGVIAFFAIIFFLSVADLFDYGIASLQIGRVFRNVLGLNRYVSAVPPPSATGSKHKRKTSHKKMARKLGRSK